MPCFLECKDAKWLQALTQQKANVIMLVCGALRVSLLQYTTTNKYKAAIITADILMVSQMSCAHILYVCVGYDEADISDKYQPQSGPHPTHTHTHTHTQALIVTIFIPQSENLTSLW